MILQLYNIFNNINLLYIKYDYHTFKEESILEYRRFYEKINLSQLKNLEINGYDEKSCFFELNVGISVIDETKKIVLDD